MPGVDKKVPQRWTARGRKEGNDGDSTDTRCSMHAHLPAYVKSWRYSVAIGIVLRILLGLSRGFKFMAAR